MSAYIPPQSRGVVLHWGERRFYLDTVTLITAICLILLGFVMVASASLHLGEKMASDSFFFPKRQLAHIALGGLLAIGAAATPMTTWRSSSQTLLLFGLLLLVVVLLPGVGKTVNGSARWVNLFGLRIQVSEIFKLIAVIYMAGFIERHSRLIQTSVQGMLRPLALLAIGSVLMLAEPDLGATAVVMTTALGMLFLAGARLWQFGTLFGLCTALGVYLVIDKAYRLRRLLAFLHPWDYQNDAGYQLTQALIAFGCGGWTGLGLGSSVQKLYYLPEAHTDFLFSVIAEELGMAGIFVVVALFALLIWRAFAIAQLAERAGARFDAFVANGIGIWFGLQAFINMGVNMGMLPTKGLTLPLMSYGGGSMLVMCVALGVLLRIRSEAVESWSGSPKMRTTWAS